MQDLRTANKARRHQQILVAAHDLIARSGFEALTMRSLADEAQVSVPTIYALVGGRDEVIAALISVGIRRFGAEIAQLDTRGLDRVTAVVELYAGIAANERELVRGFLASGVLSQSGADRFPLLRRARQELERAFAEAVEDGQLRPSTDPAAAGIAAVRLGLGAIIDWVVDGTDVAALRADLHGSIGVVMAAFS